MSRRSDFFDEQNYPGGINGTSTNQWIDPPEPPDAAPLERLRAVCHAEPRIAEAWVTGSRFHPLTVQMQHGYPCLWARVDEVDEPNNSQQRIYIRGTGHAMGNAERAKYVGTVQDVGGALVWHVFWEPI